MSIRVPLPVSTIEQRYQRLVDLDATIERLNAQPKTEALCTGIAALAELRRRLVDLELEAISRASAECEGTTWE